MGGGTVRTVSRSGHMVRIEASVVGVEGTVKVSMNSASDPRVLMVEPGAYCSVAFNAAVPSGKELKERVERLERLQVQVARDLEMAKGFRSAGGG